MCFKAADIRILQGNTSSHSRWYQGAANQLGKVALYPGLLTPVCVEEWHTFLEKQQVSLCTTNCKHRPKNDWHQSLGDVSLIQKTTLQLYRRNVPLLHMSSMLLHVTFTRPSPVLVLQLSDKCWDEKAWVRECACNIDMIITLDSVLRT